MAGSVTAAQLSAALAPTDVGALTAAILNRLREHDLLAARPPGGGR